MAKPGAAPPTRVATLGMFAACCIAPMLLIVLLTTLAGFTIGLSAALALGVVAASLCVAMMVMRHRSHQVDPLGKR